MRSKASDICIEEGYIAPRPARSPVHDDVEMPDIDAKFLDIDLKTDEEMNALASTSTGSDNKSLTPILGHAWASIPRLIASAKEITFVG